MYHKPPPGHVFVESSAEIDPRKVAEVVRRTLGRRIFGTLRNKANIIIQHYLAPFAFSLTANYVTLNGHFTLNFHY